jgi:hypothetical protein
MISRWMHFHLFMLLWMYNYYDFMDSMYYMPCDIDDILCNALCVINMHARDDLK